MNETKKKNNKLVIFSFLFLRILNEAKLRYGSVMSSLQTKKKIFKKIGNKVWSNLRFGLLLFVLALDESCGIRIEEVGVVRGCVWIGFGFDLAWTNDVNWLRSTWVFGIWFMVKCLSASSPCSEKFSKTEIFDNMLAKKKISMILTKRFRKTVMLSRTFPTFSKTWRYPLVFEILNFRDH